MPEEEKKGSSRSGTALMERGEQKYERPRMWKVIIHNDDFTPIEFVTNLVATVFRKSMEEASEITLQVHVKGLAVVGIYTHEIAETKTAQAMAAAIRNEHPLQLTMEPEEGSDP